MTLLYTTYLGMCLQSNKKVVFYSLVLVFLLLSVVLRLQLPPELSKDYIAYLKNAELSLSGIDLSYILLVLEPYRYIVFGLGCYIFDDPAKVAAFVYYINLLLNNLFFVWLSRRVDIQCSVKLIIFSMVYIVFAFIWIRASFAYILISWLLYYDFRKCKTYLGYLAPFAHLSSLPVVVFLLIKNTRWYLRGLVFSLMVISGYLFIQSELSQYSLSKIQSYIDSSDQKEGLVQSLYFAFVVLFALWYDIRYKIIRRNSFLQMMLLFYLLAQTINVVAGHRISIFFLISLLLQPISPYKKLIKSNYAFITLVGALYIFYAYRFSTVFLF